MSFSACTGIFHLAQKAKLRGVASEGMILSEREVEVGVGHDGIMVLDADVAPGTPLLDVLPISTDVLELEITPNRPDCLAIYGVAREVHAATGAELGTQTVDSRVDATMPSLLLHRRLAAQQRSA